MTDIEHQHWESYEELDKIIKAEIAYLGMGLLSREQLLELHKKFLNNSYDEMSDMLTKYINDKLTEI